ncbi:MAG: DUF1080 domain-containing protein [Akkermansiaceae bacterium]|nr:DUF1080 domain-containing protein [Verrucomicrobiales bacterium]
MAYLKFLLGSLLLTSVAMGAEATWQPLFNGKDLSGWETFLAKPETAWDVPGVKRDEKGVYLEPVGKNRDPLKVFTMEEVDGRPALHISGQGFGTITTTNSFGDCHLRFQFKWGEKRWGKRANTVRDSGLLYFGHGELGGADGAWQRSIEFQIQEKDCGDLYAIGTQIGVTAVPQGTNRWRYDPKGELKTFVQRRPMGNRCIRLEDAEKPRGEWNTIELICLNGDSIHVVNGKVVMRLTNAQRLDGGTATPVKAGQISLQTEDAEVFYRDVEIRPISEIPAEFMP